MTLRALFRRFFSTSDRTPLHGQGIVVTRPAHQAQSFMSMLQASGATTTGFPSIEICPITQSDALEKITDRLDTFHIIIFISANAVENGIKWLDNAGKSFKNSKIAAIGESTKKALLQHGLSVHYTPEHTFNSMALLDLDVFSEAQVKGQQILIVKGEGGRELLYDNLTSRGAQVQLANVYQRRVPDADIQPLLELWSKNRIQWVTVTSNEALKNLYHMMNEQGQNWLCQTRLLVPSQRCRQLAQQLGFNNQIRVAQSATDEAMLDAISLNEDEYNTLT